MGCKKVDGRCSVRCDTEKPSPFLKGWFAKMERNGLIPKSAKIVDLGCGNGRNLRHITSKGYDVTGVDMVGDIGLKVLMGHDVLPFKANTFDVILLNYVWMFLNVSERKKLAHQMGVIAKSGCKLFVEMYPAKNSHASNEKECKELLDEMQKWLGKGWSVYQKSHLRRIFWLKEKTNRREKYAINGNL